MKCLVTGAAGFIGSHLSEALIEQGHEVRGIDCFTDYYAKTLKLANLAEPKKRRGFEFVEMDISGDRISKHVNDVDIVFHLAAQPGVRASWGTSFAHYIKDNIAATQKLLEAAKEAHLKRFIYASSSSIYGDAERFPTPEETTPSPNSPYGATKLAGEMFCYTYARLFRISALCLRFFTVYGPRQRPDLAIHKFTALIEAGKPVSLFGDGSAGRDYTWVDDIVLGVLAALDYEPSETAGVPFEIFNLGNAHPVKLTELVEALERATGKRATREFKPPQPGDVPLTWADITKASRLLGYRPATGIQEGLERFVAWYRAADPGRRA